MDKSEIKFIKSKEYRVIKEIGQGGFGKAILIEDETINEQFVCKKYSPYYDEDKDLYYRNFVQEIKLLHQLNNIHIVRVFNYYLYPENQTGYILMEHIEGYNIEEFIKSNPNEINNIFSQTIEGFKHLESINILHRDIRPHNILISESGVVKIIDFGFGKQVTFDVEDFNKSISLNWRYTPPSEFTDKIYDFKTEIYFIGKLFESLISENNIEFFGYNDILKRMINYQYDQRNISFFEAYREILSVKSIGINFSSAEKNAYQKFASNLIYVIASIHSSAEYVTDVDIIISELEAIYKNSMLESIIQNNSTLVRCFIKGSYKYSTQPSFPVKIFEDFFTRLKIMPKEKQKIVLNNLWQRLDSVSKFSDETIDDLPF